MRSLAWLMAVVLVLGGPAVAQKSRDLKRAVQWQVVPEQRVVEAGKPVVFVLELRNISGMPLELRFSSGQQFDVMVYKEGEWGARWRWNRGKSFITAFTSMRLNFGEVKQFRVEWDGRDDQGRPVPPGRYRVEAILLALNPQGRREELKAFATFTLRPPGRIGGIRIRDLIRTPGSWIGRTVTLEGRNDGWQPDPHCPVCAGGPPVTRSDWVLNDGTGCIYVTGVYTPPHLREQEVQVTGAVRRNRSGQTYIEAAQVIPVRFSTN